MTARPLPARAVALCPTEHEEQCAVMRWAEIIEPLHPELALLFAIPNGGHRHKAVAGKLRASGVRRGVPDLCLPVARLGYHGLYLELKRAKGGRLSPEQAWWRAELERQGYYVACCAGARAAIGTISEYLGLKSST